MNVISAEIPEEIRLLIEEEDRQIHLEYLRQQKSARAAIFGLTGGLVIYCLAIIIWQALK